MPAAACCTALGASVAVRGRLLAGWGDRFSTTHTWFGLPSVSIRLQHVQQSPSTRCKLRVATVQSAAYMVTLAICAFALMASRMRFRYVDHLWQTALFSLILVTVEGELP